MWFDTSKSLPLHLFHFSGKYRISKKPTCFRSAHSTLLHLASESLQLLRFLLRLRITGIPLASERQVAIVMSG